MHQLESVRFRQQEIGGMKSHVLHKHAIPLLQSWVVVLRLQALCQPEEDEVEHLLHLLIWFDRVRQRVAVVLELDHVAIVILANTIYTIRSPWRSSARPRVVDLERGDIRKAHCNVAKVRDDVVVRRVVKMTSAQDKKVSGSKCCNSGFCMSVPTPA